MLVMHGAAYLGVKAGEPVASRARQAGGVAAFAALVLFALGRLATAFLIQGYAITSAIDPAGPSNPLGKTVVPQTGSWWPLRSASLDAGGAGLGFAGALLAFFLFQRRRACRDLARDVRLRLGIVATAGVSMFPFLLPSSSSPSSSLTVWDASSSRLTLGVMLAAAVVFVPIVLAYTAWVFRVLRGRVTSEEITRDPHGVY